MAGYYDLVLGLIPLTLAGISGSLYVAGVDLTVAVPAGAAVAVALIGHAMFVRTPVDDVPSVPSGGTETGSYQSAD